MSCKRLGMAMAALGLGVMAAAGGNAAEFAAPSILSASSIARDPAVAIDGAGNVFATWSERPDAGRPQIMARMRPAGAAWSDAQYLEFLASAPTIHSSGAGTVTAVWNDGSGTWAADLPAGGTWGQPQLIAPGRFYARFVMNRQGDAVVSAQVGPWYQGSQIWSVRRFGGVWGSPATIASSATISRGNAVRFEAVAIGESGDALISWEAFDRTCGTKACPSDTYSLHAARASGPATAGWTDSGALAPPSRLPQYSVPLLDGAGRAAVFFAPAPIGPIYAPTIAFVVQSRPTLPWHQPMPVFTAPIGHSEFVEGATADGSVHATVVFADSNGPVTEISAADGNLHTGVWTPPVVLSADATAASAGFLFQGNAAGGGIVEWTDATSEIHVNARQKAAQAWSAARTILPPTDFCGRTAFACSGLGGIDINLNGQWVASFTRVASSPLGAGGGRQATSLGAMVNDR